MIIDVHNHPAYHGYGVDAFVKNMDENGVDKTILLSWECPATDYDPAFKRATDPSDDNPVPLMRCIEYQRMAPDRFYIGYCPDPRVPGAISRLESALSLYNVKVCGEFKLRMMFDNPDALRLFRFCGEAGLPVLVHIDYEFDKPGGYPWPNYWYGGGIEALERAMIACPGTDFIGDAPGFWAHISADGKHLTEPYPTGPVAPGGKIQELLDRCDNLYCDISAGSGNNALRRDPGHAKEFLVKYQDRVLFGRDYFDTVHRDFLDNASLPAEVLHKIYFANTNRLCKLGL